jgi:hypothetical protein
LNREGGKIDRATVPGKLIVTDLKSAADLVSDILAS